MPADQLSRLAPIGAPDLVALLWPPASPTSGQSALALSRQLKRQLPHLETIVSGPGLSLHARGSGTSKIAVKLPERAVIGELYGGRDAANWSGTQWADRLVQGCWGRYVAFASASDGAMPGFMRDPSGMLEVLALPIGELLFVADRLPEQLGRSLGISPAIDWEIVASIAADPLFATFESPLEGTTLPLPGCWYSWDGQKLTSRLYWSPASIARAQPSLGATDVLYKSVLGTVGALAAGHETLAIELSGGLDSSILAGVLAKMDSNPALYALNIVPQSPGGDERHYARAAAGNAGAQLSEISVAPVALDYLAHRHQPRSLSPAVYGLDILADTISSDHADAVGATRIFSGQGGDAVFFQPRANAVLADHLRLHGPSRRFFSLATDMAFRRNVSVWSVIRDAVLPSPDEDHTIRSTIAEIAGHRTLAMIERPRRRHPWIEGSGELLPAKAMQVGLIANCQVFSHPTLTAAGGRLVHPFLAQPVIEAALRVPVPELTPDRRDRGLARDLFARELAPEVRMRRTKGEATGFYSRALATHLAALKPLLLDGRLAANGIVDRRMLENMLQYDILMTRDVAGLFGFLISLELWAERWR